MKNNRHVRKSQRPQNRELLFTLILLLGIATFYASTQAAKAPGGQGQSNTPGTPTTPNTSPTNQNNVQNPSQTQVPNTIPNQSPSQNLNQTQGQNPPFTNQAPTAEEQNRARAEQRSRDALAKKESLADRRQFVQDTRLQLEELSNNAVSLRTQAESASGANKSQLLQGATLIQSKIDSAKRLLSGAAPENEMEFRRQQAQISAAMQDIRLTYERTTGTTVNQVPSSGN